MRRKKERSKQGQTNKQGKKQHSTPKAVKKLPRVGLEPTTGTRTHDTLYSRQSALNVSLLLNHSFDMALLVNYSFDMALLGNYSFNMG